MPWIQVTLSKGAATKQIKNIVKMVKVKIYTKIYYKKKYVHIYK